MAAENYAINGVLLDRPNVGWRLLAATIPATALTMRSVQTVRPGRDGHSAFRTTRTATVPQFEVMVPTSDWATLQALFTAPELVVTRAGLSGQSMTGVLRSSSTPKYYARSEMVSAVFYVEVPSGCWRGSLYTSALATGESTFWEGLSASVQDALVRFKGPVMNPELTDSSGAFVRVLGELVSGKYVRFDSNTGRAWETSTDTWSGGTEISSLIDFGGPRGVFEIAPKLASGNPTSRSASLSLTKTNSSSGHGFQVRGRAAFLF